MHVQAPFKRCPGCGDEWPTRDQFMGDRNLELNGYKADFEQLEYGLFFFTHLKLNCFSTMVIEVVQFLDLYPGKIHLQRRTGEADCPGYCLDKDQLDRCEAICECAFVREIMQIIKNKKSR